MPHSDLPSTFATIRKHHIDALREVIAQQRAVHPGLTTEELVLANPDPDGQPLPELYRTLRVDLLVRKEGMPQVVEVEPAVPPVTASVTFEGPRGMKVDARPFHWNRCAALISVGSPDWSSLELWADKWLDRREQLPPTPEGLRGTMHALGQPQPVGAARYSLLVDFGTAPVLILWEWLEVLSAAGATRVQMFDASSP